MRNRVLLLAAGLLTASASIYGQANLTGKWQTDNVPAALEAQKDAPAPEASKQGGRGGGGGQAIILDLKVDASGKVSGTVNEIGNPPELMIETGMVTGKMITWVTQPRGVTWNLEVTDNDTLTLTGRVFAGRGGGAPGGGGGAKGGGAPGGGAPGGGAPGGGAPGGGAPGGGAPGGGAPGGGGGRGGGGGGRGPAAPIVFHRAK